MPLLDSNYKSPFWLRNSHASTIIPSMYRKLELPEYTRERISTADQDFLDLDWLKQGSKKLLILSHGLEGSSRRTYMTGLANYFSQAGWDVLAWNCRSCSGEMNRLPRFYHHADSDDLSCVIDHAMPKYQTIYLVGFSMGGNMSLNYLGRKGKATPSKVKGAAVFSVPLVLRSSVEALSMRANGLYRKRFIRKLGAKIREKSKMFPELISYDGFEAIKQFPDFDNRYTAPLHGFRDAYDFYEQGSPLKLLDNIQTPVLIVNAANDPFLGPECYPVDAAQKWKNVYLEVPGKGGHVGFSSRKLSVSYMESRALWFYENFVKA